MSDDAYGGTIAKRRLPRELAEFRKAAGYTANREEIERLAVRCRVRPWWREYGDIFDNEFPGYENDRAVEARLRRQEILDRTDGIAPALSVVITEASLLYRWGSREERRAQVEHLASMSRRHAVDLRIQRFDGPSAGIYSQRRLHGGSRQPAWCCRLSGPASAPRHSAPRHPALGQSHHPRYMT
jgi:transposase-like protein